jgi:predicted enzyme related to lactoylglutathione lyase
VNAQNPGLGRLVGISIDCADPATLGDFYRDLTGWDVSYADDDVVVLGDGAIRLGLQRVANHRRPDWPGPDKQLHLDFAVSDLDDAEQRLLSLGATKPEFQPGGDGWRVYQDPSGHPFCLSASGT